MWETILNFAFDKIRFTPNMKKKYKMKKIEELSPELQALIGFAKPSVDDENDINGNKARMEYLQEKYAIPVYHQKYS